MMRSRRAARCRATLLGAALALSAAAVWTGGASDAAARAPRCAPPTASHDPDEHGDPSRHRTMCGFEVLGSVKLSKRGGAGQIELHGDLAAVLRRDEGIVALVDIADPSRPKVVGRYDDGAVDSFDGDLAFSKDGRWLFYARQTHQFSRDGIHVLDVSDPKEPTLASYQPQGGTLRIAYHSDGSEEWVFSLDAIDGLVVNRFDRTTGALIPVHVDALPVLKVGGPASAGLVVDPSDPVVGSPLLYVATGRTGVDVLDISDPALPQRLGGWKEDGLADIELRATGKGRTIYAATEYWFQSSTDPAVVVLDASDLSAIEPAETWDLGLQPDTPWRVQGMDVSSRLLYVAHSHAGLVAFDPRGATRAAAAAFGDPNDQAALQGAPYAMDVETRGKLVFVSDAAAGTLTVLRAGR